MIPLMYILPKNEIFQESSAIIHSITPSYNDFRRSIQIEFKYNLDRYFYIEIFLNNYDQPESIRLYAGYSETKSKVSDLQDSYQLSVDEAVIIIEKDAILEIVNNVANFDTISNKMEIKIKIIKDTRPSNSRPVMDLMQKWQGGIKFRIENNTFMYYEGSSSTMYQPVLHCDSKKLLPYKADYNYYFYDISDIIPGYAILLSPLKTFKKHYLFRGARALNKIELIDKDIVFNSTETVAFSDGFIEHNGAIKGFDKFLELSTKYQYKKYLFNAAYDRNLYTEISLLVASVRHMGVSIYDFTENTIVSGRIEHETLVDGRSDSLRHIIRLKDTKDFFGRDYPYNFEFVYNPETVLRKSIFDDINNIASFGYLQKVDRNSGSKEIIPLSLQDVDETLLGMAVGGNKRYFISIFKERLREYCLSRIREMAQPKKVSNNDSMHGIYKLKYLDYDNKEVCVSHGTADKIISFSDPAIDSIFMSENSSDIIRDDGALSLGGINFEASPKYISTDFINIETFNDAVLLTRAAESADYGIVNIVKDCDQFKHHMFIDFGITSLLLIYNRLADKIYYIDYRRKKIETDVENLSSYFTSMISVPDESKLKMFLLTNSIGKGINRLPGAPQLFQVKQNSIATRKVNNILGVNENFGLMKSVFIEETIKDLSHLSDNSGLDIIYSPREYKNIDIVKQYKLNKLNFKQIGNGIYGNADQKILSMSVDGTVLNLKIQLDDMIASVNIKTNEGNNEFLYGQRIDVKTGDYSCDTIIPYSVESNYAIYKIFQDFSVVVVEFETLGSIAFDFYTISRMINYKNLSINGSILHTDQDYTILLRADNISSIDFMSFDDLGKENAYAIYEPENSDIILDIISEERQKEFLNNILDEDAQVFLVEENGIQGVALPSKYTTFFQFKEH